MKIGLIADDFTRINLEMEDGLRIINLSPNNWKYLLAVHSIDVLLVESAWRGFKNKWQRRIAKYEIDAVDVQLNKIIEHCKKKKIPCIFWNKEDPVNYERFKHNLPAFDVCLTTEVEKAAQYKKDFNNLKDVVVAPFFFQPKLHNPCKEEVLPELSQKFVFCGGLYANEFPDRAKRLRDGISSIGRENVVVYDRFNAQESEWNSIKGISIQPAFSYENSKKYYQSGVAHINVNSFDGSSTMFSRRMLELVASGTHVIDLTSYKGKGILSEFVTQVSSKNDTIKALDATAPDIDFQYLLETYSANSFVNKLIKYI